MHHLFQNDPYRRSRNELYVERPGVLPGRSGADSSRRRSASRYGMQSICGGEMMFGLETPLADAIASTVEP